ncbi:MAG TPA: hypothetical protein VMB20_14120 [Candidatus Acidoferrum sp.]|nr:hypothetical protein [Candidatus Acidoferrum sp.]
MSNALPAGTERVIRRDAYARCAFSAAIECAQQFLVRAADRGRIDELLVHTDVSVIVVEDYTDTVRRHDALEFRWRPRSGVFPSAHALLTVRPHAPQGTELQFSIAYQPPFRRFGRFFDAWIGRHIAWITGGLLLRRLRLEIERCAHAR